MQSRGFTLMEMLIAMGVFAVLGVLSTQLLQNMIRSQSSVSERADRLSDTQRALQIIQRDIMQLAQQRPVRDEFGDPLPAISISDRYPISLTRKGWRNPLTMPRSDLQRVAYAIEDEALVRYYWLVLDRAEDTMPMRQVMLEDVYLLEFSAIDVSGESHSFWPLMAEQAMDPEADLAAVSMRLDVPPFGELVRVWDVPGALLYEGTPDDVPPPQEAAP